MPLTRFPYGVQASPVVGAGLLDTFAGSNIFFVDGDIGLSGDGTSPDSAFTTIGAALTVAGPGATIYVKARKIAAGGIDPVSYAETVTIAATQAGLKLIGVGTGPAQGNLPQIKKGSGSTAMITVRAPGCVIANLGIDMGSSTGAGILLDDDGSTKTAFGTVIVGCHFKNNANKSAAAGGGAIAWSSNGGASRVVIDSCHFYENATGINLLGTVGSVPQDVTITNCVFYGTAANVDGDIVLSGGSGMNGLVIENCIFGVVDVPAKAAGNTDLYLDLTGCVNGAVVDCTFACTGKTFGALGNAAKVPTTIRMGNCYQENAIIPRT